jgi:hypothetical protein
MEERKEIGKEEGEGGEESTLNWIIRKDNLRTSQELAGPHSLQESGWKILNSFERLREKGEVLGCQVHQGCLGKYLLRFSYLGTQRPLHPVSNGIIILLKLTADLGILHVMLMYQVFRMQVLQCHGDIQPSFNGELLGQAMCQGGSPFRQPFRGKGVKI